MDTDPSGSGPAEQQKGNSHVRFQLVWLPRSRKLAPRLGCSCNLPSECQAPLEILWDRQGHKYDRDTQKEAYRQFVTFINQSVLPKLQELAHYFAPSDDGKFLWHFEWPHDSNMVVVATGSPNASYGYFYISVNLVPKEGVARSGVAQGIQDTRCQQNRRVEATEAAAEPPASSQWIGRGHRQERRRVINHPERQTML